MKKTLPFLLLSVFFVSCQQENDTIIEDVKIESEINYKIDYFDNFATPCAYYGDTVRFSIKYTANSEVKEIQLLWKLEDGIREHIITTLDKPQQTDSLYFEIPITELQFTQQFTDKFFAQFVVKFIKEDKTIHSNTFLVLITPLEEYNYQRLYNIVSVSAFGKHKGYLYKDGSYLSTLDYSPSSDCINCPKISLKDNRLFLVNTPNADFDIDNDIALTKDFIHGFFVPQENNLYAKLDDRINFIQIRTPQDILIIYNNLVAFDTHFENINVGDQFVFKYKYPNPFITNTPPYYFGDVYGIFEITHIEDDGLTSDNGGSDDDYIEFRLKSFGETYRFKQ